MSRPPSLRAFGSELQKLGAPQGLLRALRERGLRRVAREYSTHSALNAGQAYRDIRFVHDYPGAKGRLDSIKKRLTSLANNVKYTVKSPHSHHEVEDVVGASSGKLKDWFLHGYKPWDYPDPLKR